MVSVILPSVRPHLTHGCVQSVLAAAGEVPVQVIVITDYGPPYQSQEERDFKTGELRSQVMMTAEKRTGVVDAVNRGAALARGKYLFTLSDECVLKTRSLETMYNVAEKHRADLLTPKHVPHFDFKYYGLPFAAFPFVSRHLLTRMGMGTNMFSPAYRSFYADPDLSLQALKLGVGPVTVEDAVIFHHQQHDHKHYENVNNHMEADRAIFRMRWDYLGTFKDPE